VNIEVFPDAASAAHAAAVFIAAESRAAIASRGRFVIALSGGSTPWLMVRALAVEEVEWEAVHIFQVDERVAPAGDPERNLTHLHQHLLAQQIHAMPVESENLQAAAERYAQTLARVAGSPPVLDLVHLGLGPDGHTASLTPGDPILDIDEADVAVSQVYQGRRRMTLTYPILNRARRVLWLVTGVEKREMLRRLEARDHAIPAGRLRQDTALVFADAAAAGSVVS
jgi:6-phosphogluconolactonase